jgi:hypothetical protein
VILFQIALLLGAPWGENTMAGKFQGKLPIKIRFVVLIQIFVLILFAFIVVAKPQLAFQQYQNFGRIGM